MPRRSSTPAVSSAALATLTLGTLTRVVPRATVEQMLHRRQRMHKIACKLPAPFLVYFVIALGLQMALPTREVLRWLRQGLCALWGAAAVPAHVAGKAAISMARTRLGWEVLRDLYAACVRPLATRRPRGVRRRISQYPARPSGGCHRQKIDYTPEVLNRPEEKTQGRDF